MSEFKVLDLGAHDGFVTYWLGKQLPNDPDGDWSLHVSGLELHPGAVDIANSRANDSGLSYDYRVGLAEDASDHWDYNSFDAVVAFEVIEHVPNVDRFLDVCESMVKHDGVIYLSTPNGCFGEGQNPHHLRVYRDIDLFNLLRRRGEVLGLVQGHDGVTVCSYRPYLIAGRLEAAIYTGPGWEKWHPRDITEKGLGGSETAAAYVADELSELGYNVTIYGEVEEGMWRQVELRNHSCFDPMEERDLVVVSRMPPMFDRKINAERKVLWMHDTDYGRALTESQAENMDKVFVLSEWHRDHVLSMYPFLEGKVSVTRNGINLDFFPEDKIPSDRPRRAIYSSSPDRGLDFILEIWPEVRKHVPDAELVYCYSEVYNRVAEVNPTIGAFRDKVSALAEQEGVVNLGSLSQDKLAAAMAMCRVWLAPSYHSPGDVPFNETFCIGAVESAAAGCHRIMSKWGALPERADVGDYTLIADLEKLFWINSIVENLTDDTRFYHKWPDLDSYKWSYVAKDLAAYYRVRV